MSTSTLTKTVQSEIAAIQALAAGAHFHSAAIDVSTKWAGQFFIDLARDVASALTAGVAICIQGSQKASGDDTWRTLWEAQSDIIAASSIVTDGIEAVGQDVIECGATVPAKGDIVFFKHGTLALSEWRRVVARVVTGGSESFTIADPLASEMPQQTMFNRSNQWTPLISFDGITRMRALVVGNDQQVVFRIGWISLDSVSTA